MTPTTGLVLILVLYSIFPLGEMETVRKLRWVTSRSPLSYLSESMSSMEEFKSLILRPLVRERVSGTSANREVQDHIKGLLTAWGWHVEEDRFNDTTPYGKKEFTNIIATFDPSKPKQAVLACHFDSKFFQTGRFVAAMDSAVPCAIMLETVRQLKCLMDKGPKERSSANELGLQLIFFDGEEAFVDWTETDSLYGSRHLAQVWGNSSLAGDTASRISKIRELILLDLIGPTDTKFMQEFPTTSVLYKSLMKTEKLLRQMGFLTGRHPGPIFVNANGWGRIEDDHKPFLHKGVEVMHLISSPFPSVWHKLTDDWDHLDFDLIDDFSRIFRVFVSNLLHLQPEDTGCKKTRPKTEL